MPASFYHKTTEQGREIFVDGVPGSELPENWKWDPDYKTAIYEVRIYSDFRKVDYGTFRSWTGSRRKNGIEYQGPVFFLNTNEISRSE